MLSPSETRCFLTVLGTFLLLLRSGVAQRDSVVQRLSEMFIKEGDEANLLCEFNTTYSNPYLYWYRQFPNQPLSHILTKDKFSPPDPVRKQHSGALDVEKRTVTLKIWKASAADEATYYCALTPGGWKLIFGKGTKVVVNPDIEDSDPSVYQLKPKDKETEMDQSTQKEIGVCLFTDYSPYTLQVGINKETQLTNGSLVVVKEDEYDEKGTASYGTVLWGTLDDEFHCNAVKNGKSFETNPEDAGTCSAEDEKPVFEADERLNLLSLSVLGLRIIFFKTIAFNVLFTFRVYSRRGRK